MQRLLLPFFILRLTFKNAISWWRITVETLGFPVVMLALLLINVFLGYTLYTTYRAYLAADQQLEKNAQLFAEHQQFWTSLGQEIKGHRQIEMAQKTLAE